MKKILLSLFAPLLFAACYEDKGSYDYNFDNMNDVLLDSITFTPQAYTSAAGTFIEIQQPTGVDTTLRINVNLKQTIDTTYEHLDFAWIREYQDENSRNVIDTMKTKGYVDLFFKAGKASTYKIHLIITDTQTTLKYYKNLTVKTRPLFKNSLFVIHGEAGSRKLGNVEIIGDIPSITMDAYKKVNPDKDNNPFAEAGHLHFTAGYQTGSSSGFWRTLCVFFDNGTAKVWDPYGLSSKYAGNMNYVFQRSYGNIRTKQIIGLGNPGNMNGRKMVIDQNGKYYVAGEFYAYIPGNNGIEKTPPIGHQTDFNIATATIMGNYYIFWDNKNNRFLYQIRNADLNKVFNGEKDARTVSNEVVMPPLLDAHVDLSGLSAEYSPVDKRAVYAYVYSWDNDYNSSHAFFIFADTVGVKDGKEATYYHYELTQQLGDKDSQSRKKFNVSVKSEGASADEVKPAFSITARKLPSLRPGDFATNICYSFCYSTNYLFFIDASGKTVYRYNTSNDELYTVYEAPADYDITQIKFRSEYFSNFQQDLGRYISIALYNGKNGAVTEVKLDHSGDVDPTFKSIIYDGDGTEKFGKINDIQYVHDMTNE